MWNLVNVRVHVIISWFMIRWLVYFTIYEFNCWTFKLLQFKLLLKIGFEWITWFKWWIVYGRSCLQTSIRSKRCHFSLSRLIEANNISGNVDNLYVWQSWSKSFLMDHQAFIPIFYHLMISSWTMSKTYKRYSFLFSGSCVFDFGSLYFRSDSILQLVLINFPHLTSS